VGSVYGCGAIYYNAWKAVAGEADLDGDGVHDDSDLEIAYVRRWRQARADVWEPNVEPSSQLPAAGPWIGIFAGNLNKARITNTYNVDDPVVGTAWHLHQTLQKPGVGLFELGSEGPTTQFWGSLPNTSDHQHFLWTGADTISPAARRRVTRQWAELAYWFPTATRGMGVLEESLSSCGVRCNFTGWAAKAEGVDRHSYIHAQPFHEVWQAFVKVREELESAAGGQ